MAEIRALLLALADDVCDVVPPPDLVRRGRRRSRRRLAGALTSSVAAVAAVAVVASLVGTSAAPSPSARRPVPSTDHYASARALAEGSWKVGPLLPLVKHRRGARLTWTGKEVIALGGLSTAGQSSNNAAYDPAAGTWRKLAPAFGDIGVGDGASAWTGTELFVMPGYQDTKCVCPYLTRPQLYDPAKNSWTREDRAPIAVQSNGSAAVWTGMRVLVVGQEAGTLAAALFDPTAHAWTAIPPPQVPDHEVDQVVALSTPRGTVVWSLWSRVVPTGNGSSSGGFGIDVFLYDGSWHDLTGSWPEGRWAPEPFLAKGEIELGSAFLWCPICRGPYTPGGPAVLVDPDSFAVTDLPPDPVDRSRPTRVWTGEAEIAVNRQAFAGGPEGYVPGQASVRDPVSGWQALPTAPTPLGSNAVWTGTQLVTLSTDGRIVTFGV
jgi:hypothetical protein